MILSNVTSNNIMEKLPLHSGDGSDSVDQHERRTRPTTATFLRRLGIAVLFLVGYYLLLLKPSPACDGHHNTHLQPDSFIGAVGDVTEDKGLGLSIPDAQKTLEQTKIPLEAHIMSKCPDAKACLQKLVLPAMEQIHDKVSFKLSFIASVSPNTEEIECKHGPGECIGDMLLLCAANLPFPATEDESLLPPQYPRTPIVRSLGFANCLINDFSQIPDREFVHQCAMEFGIDFDALNKCASQQNDDPGDGGHGGPPLSGIALLRESAAQSEQLGVQTSCTVRLDDTVWCIHDNNEWKDCGQDNQGSKPSSLIEQVDKLYKERN
ncbi:unnamed protein product [Penicillium salamii]|uniref:Gamma interferon inducible lysosomal thiol reductase GILT n=1 Tax=Penicillium salamii TaxID=1612424 RepID=A0A9W4NJ21_9EURO|nr:unnamed protein product [Penicillium salamii]CAG8109906.1 unnamed protein product [Penicillium salamii]CAG8223752.1 unnamed protein product [Penicillium salamii]CAG8320779.1 unnamed protein product [Penicillium salamii]CAG8331565.1 unnamed protein product [Penicillium salamii]